MRFHGAIAAVLIFGGTITGTTITGGTITGTTITGGTIQTATSGQRVILGGGIADRIQFASGAASETARGAAIVNLSHPAANDVVQMQLIGPILNGRLSPTLTLQSDASDGNAAYQSEAWFDLGAGIVLDITSGGVICHGNGGFSLRSDDYQGAAGTVMLATLGITTNGNVLISKATPRLNFTGTEVGGVTNSIRESAGTFQFLNSAGAVYLQLTDSDRHANFPVNAQIAGNPIMVDFTGAQAATVPTKVEYGTIATSFAANAAVSATQAYGSAFSAAPRVYAIADDQNNFDQIVTVHSRTATDFIWRAFTPHGNVTGNFNILWFAIGT